MAELLIEILSEEIPARMQVQGADDFRTLVTDALSRNGLSFTSAEAHSTPRRLTLIITGLPLQNAPNPVVKKGPRIDAPQKALEGFLRSINQVDFDACLQEEGPKGVIWCYRQEVAPIATSELLPRLIADSIRAMSWPKSMRWSDVPFSWVRPLKSILALFDGEVLSGAFVYAEANGVVVDTTSRVGSSRLPFTGFTVGHRWLAPAAIQVDSVSHYRESLAGAFVLLSRADRKRCIVEGAQRLAEERGLRPNVDEALLEEIAGLVEWPVPTVGTFDQEFLTVPHEILIATMRSDQRYIPLVDHDDKLANSFVLVANTNSPDSRANIISGNERVLRARFSDAKFFWDEDRRKRLEARVEALTQLTFHRKLGTMRDKATRLESLATQLARHLGANQQHAARAAQLAKADLTSGVVFQFPEAQGVMGRYYALHDGEDPVVAEAIAQHYKPLGASDVCPREAVGMSVALADKIDTLVGFFGIGEKPTGSKDPFALRRASLGVIRILLENNVRLPLRSFCEQAYAGYAPMVTRSRDETILDLMSFLIERLKGVLRERGVSHDLLDAVVHAGVSKDDLVEIVSLVNALRDFVGSEHGVDLLAAHTRGVNILRLEEKRDGVIFVGTAVREDLLQEDAERQLSAALNSVAGRVANCFAEQDYSGCMTALAELREPVDVFFNTIMVNDRQPDVRANRLALLARLRDTMDVVADFSKIEA